MDSTMERNKTRNHLSHHFKVTDWENLKLYYDELIKRPIQAASDLSKWITDRNELDQVVEEELRWRYIRTTCNTSDEALSAEYEYFIREIEPKVKPYTHDFNIKLLNSESLDDIIDEEFEIYLRQVRTDVELYNEKNIALSMEVQLLNEHYTEINGAMTINVKGEELTFQQAGKLLQSNDRSQREDIYRKMVKRRLQDTAKLDGIFSKQLALRHKMAQNCGYANYRDFRFREMGRHDYTVEDCFTFHESIATEVVPEHNALYVELKKNLGIDPLRPWDMDIIPGQEKPLKPFDDADELIAKTVICFTRLNPYFGECLKVMNESRHMDIESRKGKAPGGYNCQLPETGMPFIFMNAAGIASDVTTMVHEGGHAVHSFLTRHLPLYQYRECPSEVAELASMTMELFSMRHWDVFYDNDNDLNKARIRQLEKIVHLFPWVATVDHFQHWVYTHPHHTTNEREAAWMNIHDKYSASVVDWSGLEEVKLHQWHRQLHIFEIPFYYIEYAMAQLGAIAMWKEFKKDERKALKNYHKALSLGYTKPIKEIYVTAGIHFDFSATYVKELIQFLKEELDELKKKQG
jgi:oligoendopeptidase F